MTDKITLIEGLFRNQYVCISELLDLKNKIETPYGYKGYYFRYSEKYG